MGLGDQHRRGRSRRGDNQASRQVRTGLNPVAISDQNEHASPSEVFRHRLVVR